MSAKLLKRNAALSVAGCLAVQLCVGIIYMWSVFKTPIVSSFGWTDAAARMVSSYMLAGFVTGGLIGGVLCDRKGPRFSCVVGIVIFSTGVGLTSLLSSETIALINLTYSALGGVGSGIAYSACINCIQKWMPGRKGLASGLAASAFGLSTVIFAPVSKALMCIFTDEATGLVNFRPVFLALAAVFFVTGMLACLLIKRPPVSLSKAGGAAAAEISVPTGKAVRTVPFWCLFFTVFFICGTWNLAVPLIYDLGIERGLTTAAATFAVSFTGIPNAGGRLIMATLSDKLGCRKTLIFLSAVTIVGSIAMIYVHSWAYIVAIAIIACAYGGPSATAAAFTTGFFGAKHSGTNYGIILLALGLSSLFFNTVANTILNGNVTYTFIMAAGSAAVPIVLMAVIGNYEPGGAKKPAVSRAGHRARPAAGSRAA